MLSIRQSGREQRCTHLQLRRLNPLIAEATVSRFHGARAQLAAARPRLRQVLPRVLPGYAARRVVTARQGCGSARGPMVFRGDVPDQWTALSCFTLASAEG